MPQRPVSPSASRGFTAIELLVTLAVFGVLLAITLPFVTNVIQRNKLEGAANQAASLMRRARMQAIQLNREALVVVAGDELVGFVDTGSTARTLDADDDVLNRFTLPTTAQLEAPAGQGNAVTFTTVTGVIFQGDGSAAEEGALRLTDGQNNYLQVGVSPRATGRVEVRKWHSGGWFLPGENGPWQWN